MPSPKPTGTYSRRPLNTARQRATFRSQHYNRRIIADSLESRTLFSYTSPFNYQSIGEIVARFTLNGETRELDIEPEMPLLWALRDELGMTGTKFGCGIGNCGACTVHIDGNAMRSCITPVSAVEGRDVTTIEGLATAAGGGGLSPVQQAWIDHQVPQCGYCQSGMIMAAASLLARNPAPTDADIDAGITNICRCGSYPRARKAIHTAAAMATGNTA